MTWSDFADMWAGIEAICTVDDPKPIVAGSLSTPSLPHLHLPQLSTFPRPVALPAERLSLCEKILNAHLVKSAEHVCQIFEMQFRLNMTTCIRYADSQHTVDSYALAMTRHTETMWQSMLDHIIKGFTSMFALPDYQMPSRQTREPAVLSSQARLLLEEAWSRDHKLSASEKKLLAGAAGITVKQVSIWFNNQRQRRKTQAKAPYPIVKPTPKTKRSTSLASSVSSLQSSTDSISPAPSLCHSTSASSFISTDNDDVSVNLSPPLFNDAINDKQFFSLFDKPSEFYNSCIQPENFPTSTLSQSFLPPEISVTQSEEPLEEQALAPPNLFDFNLDLTAGIDGDFWANIMQAAGLSEPNQASAYEAALDGFNLELDLQALPEDQSWDIIDFATPAPVMANPVDLDGNGKWSYV